MAARWYYRTAAGKEVGPLAAKQLLALAEVGVITATTEVKKRADGRWVPANKVRNLLGGMKWYYRTSAGQQEGPLSAQQLRALAQVGVITATTEVKKWSDGGWVPATNVRGLREILSKTSDPTTAETVPPQSIPRADGSNNSRPVPPQPSSAARHESPAGPRPVDPAPAPGPVYPGAPPTNWATDPTARTRSPLLHLGAGSLGTLFVIGLVMGVFGDWGASPPAGWSGDGADHRAADGMNRGDGSPPPAAPDANNLLHDAELLLLDRLANVGGSPENNVNAGIELLTKHLARTDATDRQAAALLLEHARFAVSGEKALQLLLTLNDFDRRELAGLPGGFGRTGLLFVPKSRLDALCPGFSARLRTQIVEEGREPEVVITSPSYPLGGRDHSSIETAFYETLKKNVDRAIQEVTTRRAADRQERAKRQEEMERAAPLQDGTEEYTQIVDSPGKYLHGHYSFDGLFGGPLGNVRRVRDSVYSSITFRCRNQDAPVPSRPVRNRLTFVVPNDLGNKLLDRADGESFARVYCRIRDVELGPDTFPMAVVYKIDFYPDSTLKGSPKLTFE